MVNVVAPADDAGRFDLRIDGAVRAPGTGNGGTTGPVVLLEGTHTVDEVGAGGTNLASYLRTFGGDCDAGGSVTLSAGEHRTCTISNQNEVAPCVAACNVDEQQCMAGAHTPADRQACIREKNDCVKACRQGHASAGSG